MSDETSAYSCVVIPYTELSAEALRSVIADLVTRDGTDYGAVERTFEQKAAALLRQLQCGEAKLVFDAKSETIGLMTANEWRRATRID